MKELLPSAHRPRDNRTKALPSRPLRRDGPRSATDDRDRAKLDRLGDAYRHFASIYRLGRAHRQRHSGRVRARVHRSARAHRGASAASGLHVYVDKPLDRTLEGARQVVELAEARDSRLLVGFNAATLLHMQIANNAHAPDPDAKGPGGRCTRMYAAPSSNDFIHVVDTLRSWRRARSPEPT